MMNPARRSAAADAVSSGRVSTMRVRWKSASLRSPRDNTMPRTEVGANPIAVTSAV